MPGLTWGGIRLFLREPDSRERPPGRSDQRCSTATLLVVRNQRILNAWNTRQEENQRRAANGLPPRTHRRRRKILAGLAAGPP